MSGNEQPQTRAADASEERVGQSDGIEDLQLGHHAKEMGHHPIFGDMPASFDAAAALFDAADPIPVDFMIGCWHGWELPTQHPLDGILDASGWWGKEFIDADVVNPLLYGGDNGSRLWACHPARIPLKTLLKLPRPLRTSRVLAVYMSACRPVLQTQRPTARLRTVTYRGQPTAAMVYDHLPIIDAFRRIADDVVIGAMDYRHCQKPYFFALQRVGLHRPVGA